MISAPKKRGRKAKVENLEDKKEVLPKKRGRKPKGGKIVTKILPSTTGYNQLPNIILHLKCSLDDLDHVNNPITNYHFSKDKNELLYEVINDPKPENGHFFIEVPKKDEIDGDRDIDNKIIWKKLKQLKHNFHNNDIINKCSDCFWCTYTFENQPVHIPKFYHKEVYESYGCFCSPECGVAYLMNETLDTSVKFERYYIMNNIYGSIYNYTKNIKPAPSPYYLLEKYYGNMDIHEFRKLNTSDKLIIVVDKPLTRIFPELHEDNDEFMLNSKLIPSSNIKQRYKKK
jgi:hypothetical protein